MLGVIYLDGQSDFRPLTLSWQYTARFKAISTFEVSKTLLWRLSSKYVKSYLFQNSNIVTLNFQITLKVSVA